MIAQLEYYNAQKVPRFQGKVSKSVQGSFVFEYSMWRKTDQQSYFSKPVIVDGHAFQLKFFPNGWKDAKGTHISVGMRRTRLSILNIETSDKHRFKVKMIHPSDSSKDFVKNLSHDWTDTDSKTSMTSKFFKFNQLELHGFIHPDGGLKFEFEIKKQNLQTKIDKLESANQKLQKEKNDLLAMVRDYEIKQSMSEKFSVKTAEILDLSFKETEKQSHKMQRDDFFSSISLRDMPPIEYERTPRKKS